jgi:hypothetical protein
MNQFIKLFNFKFGISVRIWRKVASDSTLGLEHWFGAIASVMHMECDNCSMHVFEVVPHLDCIGGERSANGLQFDDTNIFFSYFSDDLLLPAHSEWRPQRFLGPNPGHAHHFGRKRGTGSNRTHPARCRHGNDAEQQDTLIGQCKSEINICKTQISPNHIS